MTSAFFWPSLIMVIALCIFSFSMGFHTGRIYQEDQDAKANENFITHEEAKRLIDKAIADFFSEGKAIM